MKRLIIFLSIVMLAVLPFISAEQTNPPTQQYNKIFLNPFYRESLSSNTNYSYNVTVNPPDKVSSVLNAILSFNAQINGQTQTFFIWVNGQPCNNANYSVATAFSTTGNVQFSFDCSNRITKAGVYNITMRSSVNTGAMNGWLDLTYMNNPPGSASIFGTEYTIGDRARIFLQVKDSQGFPENDAECFIDVYYPMKVNSTADIYINDAALLHANGSDGLYFYDINQVPNDIGVYMMSASCSYQLLSSYVYYLVGDVYSPTRYNTTGTYGASTLLLNDYGDSAYTSCSSGGGGTKVCQAIYDFDLTAHFTNFTNVTALSLYYMGEATYPVPLLFEVWNFNSSTWYKLPNNLTFTGLATTAPTGLNDFVSNSLPLNIPNLTVISPNGTIRIRTNATYGTGFSEYDNWLNIKLTTTSGSVQDLKGSGELHVTNNPSAIANQTWNYNGTINSNVKGQLTNYTWSYNGTINKNITDQITNATWTYNGTIARNITDQITNSTWTYNGTIVANVVTQLNNLTLMGPLVANYIWNSTNRSLTYTDNIASAVWSYNGTITPNIIQILVNATWAYTGTVSSNILNQMSNATWSYTGGSVQMVNTLTNATWNYAARYTHGVILN